MGAVRLLGDQLKLTPAGRAGTRSTDGSVARRPDVRRPLVT